MSDRLPEHCGLPIAPSPEEISKIHAANKKQARLVGIITAAAAADGEPKPTTFIKRNMPITARAIENDQAA